MNMSALRNARSEFEKFNPWLGGGAGVVGAGVAGAGVAGASVVVVVVVVAGALGCVPGGAGVVRGGAGDPAGCFGSKNPDGFGIVATSSMFRATWPASRKPGFSVLRGSFDSAAAGLSCARP